MSLKGVAKQTLTFLETGHFTGPNGGVVHLADALQAAVDGTRLYTPDQGEPLLAQAGVGARAAITVTRETTQLAAHRRDPMMGAEVEACLRHRAGLVLAAMRGQGERNLVLGAWGCGVFRNSPAVVADAFGRWLEGPVFAGAFDQVVFAIYDPSKSQTTLAAFLERFEEDS